MSMVEISFEHLEKPAHQVIGFIIKAIEKNVQHQRWLMLLHHHSSVDANTMPQHPEALHDFRVELRRLRVWLVQSRGCVATRRAARTQLRRLAKLSNAPRDREVFLDLLAKTQPALPRHEPRDSAPCAHPNTQKPTNTRTLIQALAARLPKLAPRRRKQKPQAFGLWLAQRLKEAQHQSEVCFNGNETCLHKARIHIKHLRYLIEPLAALPIMTAAISHLKSLQTTLGDLHDLYLMRQLIAPWVCTQLNGQLSELISQPMVKKNQIQQAFNPARDEFIRAIHWQTTQYQAALNQWDEQAASHRQTLETNLRAVIDVLTAQGKPDS